jgi:very-short-patch-repair endonuclease
METYRQKTSSRLQVPQAIQHIFLFLDFYCPRLRLAIEIDGGTHWKDEELVYDKKRQTEIEHLGIQFLRFNNEEVLFNLNSVMQRIEMKVKELK